MEALKHMARFYLCWDILKLGFKISADRFLSSVFKSVLMGLNFEFTKEMCFYLPL